MRDDYRWNVFSNGYIDCSLFVWVCCWMMSNGMMIVVKKGNLIKFMNLI